MPIRIFWSMASSVDRLQAADEIGLFDVTCAAAAEPKSRNEFREALRERLGSVTRTEKPRSSEDEIMSLFNHLEG